MVSRTNHEYDIVIVGASAAGLTAATRFREVDRESSILMISKEGNRPYSRVQIPYILRGAVPYENIYLKDDAFFEEHRIHTLEDTVVSMDAQLDLLELADGDRIHYKKLLIATGTRPLAPKIPGIDSPGVYNLWDLEDLDALLEQLDQVHEVIILGSGFISLQAAWAYVVQNKKVTILELRDHIMANSLDAQLAAYFEQGMSKYSVNFRKDTQVIEIERADKLRLRTSDNVVFEGDVLVMGVGTAVPRAFYTDQIAFDHGILVNRRMQTSKENIYAAGDVALVPLKGLDQNCNLPLWSTAVQMGSVAGWNLAGRDVEYEGAVRSNVTEMFGMTIITAGDLFGESQVFTLDYGVLKLFTEQSVLVGFVFIGQSEEYELFGPLLQSIRDAIMGCVELKDIQEQMDVRVALALEVD